MTRIDHRVIFTALGFLAVFIRGDVAQDKQAIRATSIARLIESFCITSVPDAFAGEYLPFSVPPSEIAHLLEGYIAELRDNGSMPPSFDRRTLLAMYELLLTQKSRHDKEEFYASAPDSMIAERILQLSEEQIRREEP